MANRRLKSLRNEDYSDLELLHICQEVANDDGIFFAEDVAHRLGIRSNGKRTPAGTVSVRLSWMRRFEYVDRIDPKSWGGRAADPPGFIITDEGARLMNPRTEDGKMLDRQREIAERAFARGSTAFGFAVRRQFMHTYANRKR